MANNIFQVINENHLSEILENNVKTLTVVMMSSKECPPCKAFKPRFVAFSKEHQDCLFVYIDILNYKNLTNKYTTDLKSTPTFYFYFNETRLAVITGAHDQTINNTILTIKEKIEQNKKEFQQKDAQLSKQKQTEIQQVQIEDKKLELLKKLKEMNLGQQFTLESDYDEMLFEYKFNTDVQFRQRLMNKAPVPAQPPQEDKCVDGSCPITPPSLKQQQLKQIQDLNAVNNYIQNQQLMKLQQLKHIQKLKEMKESNDKK